jgi:hypothetical protein
MKILRRIVSAIRDYASRPDFVSECCAYEARELGNTGFLVCMGCGDQL